MTLYCGALRRISTLLSAVALSTLLSACSPLSAISSVASSAMELAGLKEADDGPIDVSLAMHAGSNLNASGNMPMAVVAKIYYLKGLDSFARAPMDQLIDSAQEKAILGSDLIASRDITLTPGQRYKHLEKVPRDAGMIGVVVLFHSPAPYRWKFAFDTQKAADTGILIGVHACAMSVSKGEVIFQPGAPKFDPSRLLSVQCN